MPGVVRKFDTKLIIIPDIFSMFLKDPSVRIGEAQYLIKHITNSLRFDGSLDELDKLLKQFQEKLLNFLESGRIKVDQMKRQYDFEIKSCKVFATANELGRLSRPLQSRFRKLFLPRYSEQQFIEVAIKVLPKVGENLALYIGFTTFRKGGDIRDVISIGKLVKK